MMICVKTRKEGKGKMKKLLFAAAIAASAMLAQADVAWSTWMDNSARTDLSFGIASKCSSVSTFELTLLYGGSSVDKGVQWSFLGINDSDKANVLQLSWWSNRGDDSCVQLGMINVADQNAFNLGLVNVADKSKIQLGFLNFNKNGLLPFFPFINLDKSLFD